MLPPIIVPHGGNHVRIAAVAPHTEHIAEVRQFDLAGYAKAPLADDVDRAGHEVRNYQIGVALDRLQREDGKLQRVG